MVAVYEARDRAVRDALGAKPEETTEEAARRVKLGEHREGRLAGLRESLDLIAERPELARALVAERIGDVLAQAGGDRAPVSSRRCSSCGRGTRSRDQVCGRWRSDGSFCKGTFY
jgi:hypothetical protein